MIQNFRKIFRGIPPIVLVTQIAFSIIWGIFNAYYSAVGADIAFKTFDTLPAVAVSIAVFVLTWSILEIGLDLEQMFMEYTLENEFQKYYMNELYKIKPSVLKASNTGYISTLMTKCMASQLSLFDTGVVDVLTAVGFIGYYVKILWKYSYVLSIEVLAIILVATLFRLFTRWKYENKIDDIITEKEANRNRLVYDGVANINTIQKMRAIRFMDRKLSEHCKDVIKSGMRYSITKESGFIIMKTLINMSMPLFIITVYFLNLKDNLAEVLVLSAACGARLLYSGRTFERFINRYFQFVVRLNKLEKILDKENVWNSHIINDVQTFEIKDAVHSYIYKGDGKNYGKSVTVSIPEFSFKKGDRVCIYGESGQGKTTLLNIISNEIACGNIKINGETADGRIRCAFVAQDTEILDLSLRDNLTMGRDVKDATLIAYLEKVGMKEWFTAQPDGLDTILGERGVFVSTGQRQRLNLIRGLLDIPYVDVFLLDEPTSNVDEETERILIKLIDTELKDKTIVVVTHKLAIKNICNKHYLFENGECRLDQ